ncbi:MAG: hypothetical protein M0036_04180 [Desulfobacteraceae bacterium]|nr:hypothetical protein [Desulfobacteraceae bacterium]
MHTYLLTPLAPLVLRTGKPFGETGGSESFPFPLPSTVAGAMRTTCADQQALNFLSDKEQIITQTCHGALPAQVAANGLIKPLFPRPADARYVRPENDLILQRLSPIEPGAEEGSDLPDGLWPVFLETADKSKPSPGPIWWAEQAIQKWLQGDVPEPGSLGPEPPPIDMRTHVALDPATLAADTGRLFQSAGPDFEALRKKPGDQINENGWHPERSALMARFSQPLVPTLLRLGGEVRMSAVAPCDSWPRLPETLRACLEESRSIRLILATSALFSNGWKPGWLDRNLTGSPPGIPGLVLRLKAAAVERWQAISGWDMAAKKPKAVRRLTPAGTVYWFEVLNAPKDWAEQLWLTPISDNEQDRCDGFGLTVPGIWKR